MMQIIVLSKSELEAIGQLKTQIQELQAERDDLKVENSRLKMLIRELEWRVDPYSPDGDAICNCEG